MSPAIFGQAMGAFALFGLTVPALRFPVRCTAGHHSAGYATIGLPAPATPADVKSSMTATTDNGNQQHDFDLEIRRKPRYDQHEFPNEMGIGSSVPKSPKCLFRAFPIYGNRIGPSSYIQRIINYENNKGAGYAGYFKILTRGIAAG